MQIENAMQSPDKEQEIIIRMEQAGDAAAISDLVYAAFLNHPHHPPGSLPTEHRIVDGLRNGGALTLSLVAVTDDGIAGHIAFSPVRIDGQNCDWYGLGPVAVRPDRQHRGIGGALVRDGLARLREMGAAGVVLLGEPAYYGRFGFVADARLVLPDVPADYVLIHPFTAAVPQGIVSYDPAFG